MATRPAASPLLVLLFLISVQFGSADQTIRAEPGQTVILPCEAHRNKNELIIDWSKPDLGENDNVVLYRDDRIENEGQNPAYKNRVDLPDREIKNRNVSLVLKNVTINDTGKYECRVHPIGSERRKRAILKDKPIICNITLLVSAPGREDEQKKDEGTSTGLTVGLPVGLSVGLLVPALLAVIVFLLYVKPRRSSQEQNQPPAAEAELQAMNVENHQEPES